MPETKSDPIDTESNLSDTIERIVGAVTRRRWWIIGPACCIPIAVIAIAMKLPNRYVSQATLLVVQQRVSQRYVQPGTTTTMADVVQAMRLEILSAGRLLAIIKDFDLYGTEKDRPVPEVLVEKMRLDIDIEALESADPTPGRNDVAGVTIAFTAATPHLAQEVTSRLTSLFIEQNLKVRGDQASGTTKFLSDQLDTAKQRLAEQEQRLQSFKTSNLGELPEQQQSNLVSLTDVRARLEAVTDRLLQAQQRQGAIESPLRDRLTRLQSEKAELLTHYTPRYPDVVRKDREIARVQAVLDRLKGGTPAPPKTQDADPPEDQTMEGIITQAEANTEEIASLSKQQQKLKAESEQYQTRLNLAPVREQQLSQILRDYDLSKQDYVELQKNKMQSQLTTSLEENQEGQQFRLLDAPTLPVKPSSPKRLKICLGGLAGGVLVGFVLGFLIDLRDSSFHNERTLIQKFALPLVLGVPLVLTPAEKRARLWKMAFEWSAASLMTLTVLAAEFYVFRKG